MLAGIPKTVGKASGKGLLTVSCHSGSKGGWMCADVMGTKPFRADCSVAIPYPREPIQCHEKDINPSLLCHLRMSLCWQPTKF